MLQALNYLGYHKTCFRFLEVKFLMLLTLYRFLSLLSITKVDNFVSFFQTAFISLALLNNMRSSFRLIPSCITAYSQGSASVQRIDSFLSSGIYMWPYYYYGCCCCYCCSWCHSYSYCNCCSCSSCNYCCYCNWFIVIVVADDIIVVLLLLLLLLYLPLLLLLLLLVLLLLLCCCCINGFFNVAAAVFVFVLWCSYLYDSVFHFDPIVVAVPVTIVGDHIF